VVTGDKQFDTPASDYPQPVWDESELAWGRIPIHHPRRKWNVMLDEKTGPRAGLVWAGSAADPNDRQFSLPCNLFAPLFDIPAAPAIGTLPTGADERLGRQAFPLT
jgi:hypothetical protein